METNYHETIGAAILELFRSYEEYYGIYETYYAIGDNRNPERITITVGIAPSVEQMGGGRAGKLETTIGIPKWNLETLESARVEIPTIHKAFIRELHAAVRKQLIHMHQDRERDTINT